MQLFMTSVSGGVESIEYLKNNINSQTQLIVLPFAHDFKYINSAEDVYDHYDRDFNNKDSIYWRTVRPFIDIGINPDRIVIANVYDGHIPLLKQKLLSKNTIVYLPGGFPENIVKILYEFRLIETLIKCEIVVGESAGSMFWSKKYFVYPDHDYKKYRCYRGIKMTKGFVMLPHVNPEDKKQYKKIINSTRKFKKFHREAVYLVKDGGWIWYDSNCKKIKGKKDCYVI